MSVQVIGNFTRACFISISNKRFEEKLYQESCQLVIIEREKEEVKKHRESVVSAMEEEGRREGRWKSGGVRRKSLVW